MAEVFIVSGRSGMISMKSRNSYLKISNLILGDCKEKMTDIESNSIDSIVTDPPYGIAFMGKDWDKVKFDELFIPIWKESLRILKSGGFAFVMCSPRADVMSKQIECLKEAGFKVDFTPIFWLYKSGFPKAMNISKKVDKRGEENEKYSELSKELCDYLKSSRKALGLSQKDVAKYFLSRTKGLTGCVWNWENGANIPTMNQWNKLKVILKLDNEKFNNIIERAILKRIEAEREIIGKDGRTAKESIFNIGIQKEWDITLSKTLEAKSLDGSYGGFQPKPAIEVILVAMKPLSEKTYVNQALKNKKGITWLDDGRIPHNEEFKETIRKSRSEGESSVFTDETSGFKSEDSTIASASPKGRFPANFLISGIKVKFKKYFDLDKWHQAFELSDSFIFDVPKPSKAEKNKGCENLPLGKPPASGRSKPAEGRKNPLGEPRQNFHPTCKPIDLMKYLIIIGSREGDTILDPFMGSGTTGIACRQTNREFIGIELKKEYFEIAKARINSIPPNIKEFKIYQTIN